MKYVKRCIEMRASRLSIAQLVEHWIRMDHAPCLTPSTGHGDAQCSNSDSGSGDGGKSIGSGSSLATCWI